MDRRWLRIGVLCVAAFALLANRAEAAGPINVTALPAPCTSAIPNDGGDDQPAIQCAINNILVASGGELFIPAGWYFLDSPVTITNKNVTLRGAGQRMTRLLWRAGTTNGIIFTSNSGSFNHTFGVKSMSLNRFTGAGGTAIDASWRTPSWQGDWGGVSATIFDVYIAGVSSEIRWQHGIRLTNAVGARIHTFNIHGDQAHYAIADDTNAIKIAGRSIGVSINDGDMGRWTYGINVTDQSEAVQVENVEGSEHQDAYRFSTTGKGHVLAHSHCSVSLRAVLVENSSEVAITDNLFYVNFPTYTGIEIKNLGAAGTGFRIRGNDISTAFGTAHGIVLEGNITDSVIIGNKTAGMQRGIWLKPGVNNSLVTGNRNRAYAITPILDQGAGNNVVNNHNVM